MCDIFLFSWSYPINDIEINVNYICLCLNIYEFIETKKNNNILIVPTDLF